MKFKRVNRDEHINSDEAIEKLVSGDTGAESELQPQFNPIDSNNLIVSVIRTAPNSFTVRFTIPRISGKPGKRVHLLHYQH